MDDPVITEHDRALARVHALAAKTTANGCTEAEAQAAAKAERQAAARETRRLRLITGAISATSALGLIAIYGCAVVAH